MGNTLTLAYNKIQYSLSKQLNDPDADNFAKQQAAQAAQNKAAAARKAVLDAKKVEMSEKTKENQDAAQALAARSKFSSPQVLLSKISKSILSIFTTLIIIAFAVYGGKIEANKAIGYSVPVRILSFLYGMLFFIIVIPRSLYEIYWLKRSIPDYAVLPIMVYEPNGWIEQFFFGLFAYTEDSGSKAAHEEVVRLYKDSFSTSIGIATTVASVVNSTKPTSPKPTSPNPVLPVPKGVPVAIISPKPTSPKPVEAVPKGVQVAITSPKPTSPKPVEAVPKGVPVAITSTKPTSPKPTSPKPTSPKPL